jgi:Tfp pilus assembly protein PilF
MQSLPTHIGIVLVVALTGALPACSPGPEESGGSKEPGVRFRNVLESTEFVGDEACFDCHEDEYTGYQSHGMARSYYALTGENRLEATDGVAIEDPSSDLIYTVVESDGSLYQEEFERGEDGTRQNVIRRRMDYVVGSGGAARTYLTDNNGRLYQLPLTWYTQTDRWDFSPGYRIVNHRFTRLVPDRGMACHNSYPESVPFVEGKYARVPDGIGCERCHGPGALHVEERLEVPEPASEIDDSIVNPAYLSINLRLDVCQQCHLHTTVSMLREGEEPFGFRPSHSLASHVSLFALQKDGSDEQIDVISHADRMRQSVCFLASSGTSATLECTTCHDPHAGFRDLGPGYFNESCIGCHAIEALRSRLSNADVASSHEENSNCIDCHMPKVEADDAPHASFTDHKIRVVRRDERPATQTSDLAIELRPYFDRDRESADGSVYENMALVIYGRQTGRSDLIRKGTEELMAILETDTTRGEAHFLAGLGSHALGDAETAIPFLETAVRRAPNDSERLNALAQAYESAGRSAITIGRLYRRALAVQPASADIRVNYGRFLQARERFEDAETQYKLAIDENPWLTVAWHNLGTLQLATGDREAAAATFRETLRLDPLYTDAMGNLAALNAIDGNDAAAELLFVRAVNVAPGDRNALGNLGAYRLNQGRLDEAIELLDRAVAADSTFADGLANLALAYFRSDNPGRARVMAMRALDIDPSSELDRQVLTATE